MKTQLKKMTDLESLFDISYGHSLELNRLQITTPEAGIPFISRKMGDNGVSAYVKYIPGILPNKAGELTCALSGNGVLTTHIQERPYYTSFHVACLRPKTELTKQQLLFYCLCIQRNRYRFSYGRQANRTLRTLRVPAISQIPSWVTAAVPDMFSGNERPVNSVRIDLPPLENWKTFTLESLFELKKGKRITKAKLNSGAVPFITAIDSNNGLREYFSGPAIFDANTITVNYNGNGVAEAFYQPDPYWACDDVNVLYPKFPLTESRAMFINTIIRKEKYRFNYGRKWHLERMRDSSIKLPANKKGQPDWDLIESYIKGLSFSSALKS